MRPWPTAVMHPVDTVKVRKQALGSMALAAKVGLVNHTKYPQNHPKEPPNHSKYPEITFK